MEMIYTQAKTEHLECSNKQAILHTNFNLLCTLYYQQHGNEIFSEFTICLNIFDRRIAVNFSKTDFLIMHSNNA